MALSKSSAYLPTHLTWSIYPSFPSAWAGLHRSNDGEAEAERHRGIAGPAKFHDPQSKALYYVIICIYML